jgi:hypothetical protein
MGYTHQEGLDYSETISLVAKLSTVTTLLAMVLSNSGLLPNWM